MPSFAVFALMFTAEEFREIPRENIMTIFRKQFTSFREREKDIKSLSLISATGRSAEATKMLE